MLAFSLPISIGDCPKGLLCISSTTNYVWSEQQSAIEWHTALDVFLKRTSKCISCSKRSLMNTSYRVNSRIHTEVKLTFRRRRRRRGKNVIFIDVHSMNTGDFSFFLFHQLFIVSFSSSNWTRDSCLIDSKVSYLIQTNHFDSPINIDIYTHRERIDNITYLKEIG